MVKWTSPSSLIERIMTTTTMTFSVTDDQQIHCDGCEQRISRALERLEGVQTVDASAQSQRIVIETDPAQTGLGQLRERLDLLGYDVTNEEIV
jgi:copper chaperone CopZ